MAKCKHCGQKKGKRQCPALNDVICAQCCATHRLDTIQCPADCMYLQSEFYQQGRRSQKARSRGKKFLVRVENDFHSEAAQGFAFMIQADLYWWCSRNGGLSNLAIAKALEASASTPGLVIVEQENEDPLAEFLVKLFRRSSRYSALGENWFDADAQKKVLTTLASCAEKHQETDDAGESRSFLEEINSYFDQLDFEADLDYSPLEELEEKTNNPAGEEREGGLVLPGQ